MKKKLVCCVSLVAAYMMAATVFGAIYESRILIGGTDEGILHPYPDSPSYNSEVPNLKPPAGLRSSDVWIVNIDYHVGTTAPGPNWGWAGARIGLHNLDPFEVDVYGIGPGVPLPGGTTTPLGIRALHDRLPPDLPNPGVGAGAPPQPQPAPPWPTYSGAILPGPLPSPLGPASANFGSVQRAFTMIHPLAQASGISPSAIVPLLRLTLHAKNTFFTPGNSDTDVEIRVSDIWHSREGPGSSVPHLGSNYIWAQSTPDWNQYHNQPGQGTPGATSQYRIPEGPPIDFPNGHWVHIPGLPFHNQGGPGSAFVAVPLLGFVPIGIDHIPEPTSVVLLSLAVVCTVMGMRSRRRRS